jgi:hypothetical protein
MVGQAAGLAEARSKKRRTRARAKNKGTFTDTKDGNLWCQDSDGGQELCDADGQDCHYIPRAVAAAGRPGRGNRRSGDGGWRGNDHAGTRRRERQQIGYGATRRGPRARSGSRHDHEHGQGQGEAREAQQARQGAQVGASPALRRPLAGNHDQSSSGPGQLARGRPRSWRHIVGPSSSTTATARYRSATGACCMSSGRPWAWGTRPDDAGQ